MRECKRSPLLREFLILHSPQHMQYMRHTQLKLICGAAVAEYTMQLCIGLSKQTGRNLRKQYW